MICKSGNNILTIGRNPLRLYMDASGGAGVWYVWGNLE